MAQLQTGPLLRNALYAAVEIGDIASVDAYFDQESVRQEVVELNNYISTHAPSASLPMQLWYLAPSIHAQVYSRSLFSLLFDVAIQFDQVEMIAWFFSPARVATMGATLARELQEVCSRALKSLASCGVEILEIVLSSPVFRDILPAESQQRTLKNLMYAVDQEPCTAARDLLIAHGARLPIVVTTYTGKPTVSFRTMELATLLTRKDILAGGRGGSPVNSPEHRRRLNLVCHMLSRDAVDTTTEVHVALWLAASYATVHEVQVLLEQACVDVDVRGSWGRTALLCAPANRNAPEIVKLLLEYGADITLTNDRKQTALHVAVRNVQTAVVQLLLQHGADPNATDIGGAVPLDGADLQFLRDSKEVAEQLKLLLQFGAYPFIKGRGGYSTHDRLVETEAGKAMIAQYPQ